ncbi:MAG TPA: DUF2271 domain-containing protein [Hyphomicrobiales bacterium]|nr:DUF2271 domain-containing protein [Hyphomicrobiales bacterium]
MLYSLPGVLLVLAALLPGATAAQDVQHFEQRYAEVLGTTLELSMYGPDLPAMERAAAAALAEIERLDGIFSHRRQDSEVMRLNRARLVTGASSELLDLIELCAQWEQASESRFSCKLGRLQALWDEAERSQVLPDQQQLRRLAATIATARPALFRGTRTVSLPEPVELDMTDIATGFILDHVLTLLRRNLPDATAIGMDLVGTDAIYWGQPPAIDGWHVDIAHPLQAEDGGPLITLSTTGRAITVRSHLDRYRTIAGQRYSQTLVPGSGWPVENGIGAIALASSAVASNVAATAMTLQSTAAAIAWTDAQDNLDAMALDASGNHAESARWQTFVAEETSLNDDSVLALTYTLPPLQPQGTYYRPYLAIWISDPDQRPRKNLLLLGQEQRWARENSRWWRRVGRTDPSLVDGIARPTRAPGEYRLIWDGRDEDGAKLAHGDYLLHLEAARQEGGHSYLAIPFSLGTAQSLELPGEGELGRIVLDTVPRR